MRAAFFDLLYGCGILMLALMAFALLAMVALVGSGIVQEISKAVSSRLQHRKRKRAWLAHVPDDPRDGLPLTYCDDENRRRPYNPIEKIN